MKKTKMVEYAKVSIKNYYEQSKIGDILNSIDSEFIGLDTIKNQMYEICALLLVDSIRKKKELTRLESSLHMAFIGRSGTGKTSIGIKMAEILRNLGYLTKGHLINVNRDDLVGQYVGHTAPKTREQLQKAHGGVLFIDDAHHLYKSNNERDYGIEAIELLLQVMENQRDNLVLIFGGEKEKLENFFNSNQGISSRIGNYLNFSDYAINDLVLITKFLLKNSSHYTLSSDSQDILFFYIDQMAKHSAFANIRTIKTFLNQLFNFQSARIEKRLVDTKSLDYKSLLEIEYQDFEHFKNEDFINIIGDTNIKLFKKN